jgi:hypothetical protein
VIQDIRVPNFAKVKESGEVVYRHFYKGTIVEGKPTTNCETCVKGSDALIVDNSFMIPMEHLQEVSKKEANKLNGIGGEKSPEQIYKQGMMAGVLVGVLAYVKLKRHFVWLTVGGALAGGYIAHKYQDIKQNTKANI